MLRCTSRLERFKLEFGRCDHSQHPLSVDIGEPLKHVHEILRSATELKVQILELYMFQQLKSEADIAQHLLESTVSRKLVSLTVCTTKIDEKVLLEALPRWASSLITLSLGEIILLNAHDGWPAVLRALSRMPRLSKLTLDMLCERHDGFGDRIRTIIDRGAQAILHYQNWGMRKYEGRTEVSSGLEEILAGPFTYKNPRNELACQRTSDGSLEPL
jgi:hypothetical protein